MSRAVAAVLAFGFSAAAAAWLLLAPSPRFSFDGGVPAVAPEHVSPPQHDVTPVVRAAVDAHGANHPDDLSFLDTDLDALFCPAGEAESPEHDRLVRVVDVRGRPVPGATVTWDDSTATTDEAGEVTVQGGWRTTVSAQRGPLFAAARVRFGLSEPVVLTVDAASTLHVATIDALSRPVPDIPVTVRNLWRIAPHREDHRSRDWSGVTAGRDAAVFLGGAASFTRGHLLAFVSLPLFEDEPTRVTHAELIRRRVVLRLPPGAPFSVALTDADGAPFVRASRIWVRDADTPSHADAPAEMETMTLSGPRGRLPWVPLSRRYEVSAAPLDGSYAAVHTVVDGPVRSGHGVDVALRYTTPRQGVGPNAAGRDRLIVRLVTPRGRPWRNAWVRWTLTRGGRLSGRGTARLDGGGRLEVPFTPSPPTLPARLDLDRIAPHSTAGPEPARATTYPALARAALDVIGRLVPGGADLGDVVLREPPVAVRGRVVDPSGAPIPDATLSLARSRGDRGVVDRGTTGRDGAFALRHADDPRALALTVTHRRFIDAELPCPATPETREITLVPSAGVAGRVRFGDLPREAFDVSIVQGRRLRRTIEVDAAGAFELWGLEPGRCALFVSLAGEPVPLVRHAGVELQAGLLSRDPRLAEVDLEGSCDAIVVTVTDASGTPRPGVTVRARSDHGRSRFETGRDGRATVLAPAFPVDVSVEESGWHDRVSATVAHAAAAEVTLVLRPRVPRETAAAVER